MSVKPKKKCCLSKPRCTRCPIRMLAEGTLPDGFAVHRLRLVKVDKGHPKVTTSTLSQPGKKSGKAAEKAGKAAKKAGKTAKKAGTNSAERKSPKQRSGTKSAGKKSAKST